MQKMMAGCDLIFYQSLKRYAILETVESKDNGYLILLKNAQNSEQSLTLVVGKQ